MEKVTKWERLLWGGLAAIALVYGVALIKIVLLKNGLTGELRDLQLVPFAFVDGFIHPVTSIDVVCKNVLGNFAIFVPLGILLPLFFKKLGFGRTVLAGFLTSLGFEVVQYIIGCGMSDVDDLLLNTLGALAGAGLYFGLFFRKEKPLRGRFCSFVFLAVFGCLGVLSLWLYHPSALPIQWTTVNEGALGGAARDSYTVSAMCTGVKNGVVSLQPDTVSTADEGTPVQALDSYPLAEDASILMETRTSRYSPNGNIQGVTVEYRPVHLEELTAQIAQDGGGFADLWLNSDGGCVRIVYTVFAN